LIYTVDGGAQQTAALTNSTATVTLAGLTAGSHIVRANYSGDSNYAATTPTPVTLTVTSATSLAATVALTSVTPGNTAAQGQSFTLTYTVQGATGQPLPTGTLSYTVDGGAAQTAALTNAVATITLSGLAAGSHTVQANYSGDTNYGAAAASPVTLTVTAVTPPPVINPGGLVGAAGSSVSASPGGLASIYGTNLAGSTVYASATPLPTILGGVQVLVNGVAAPLIYVSPTQINFQIPYQTPTGTPLTIVVVNNGASGTPLTLTLPAAAPAIFTYQRTPTSTDPVILHANNTLVTPTAPAVPGEVLVIYATGVGQLNNAPATGAAAPISPLATTVATPIVTVGGSAAVVQFSGLTPTYVGLLQINIQLPSTLPAGTGTPPVLPLVVTYPGAASATVNLWVSQ
jgi:uncharacterized protein (TIGR03437 family)